MAWSRRYRCVLPALALAAALSAPAGAAGLYDGTYAGYLVGGDFNYPTCAKRSPVQITIRDNQLEYHHFNTAVITATVKPDGSFSGTGANTYSTRAATSNQQTLTGRIDAGRIEADTEFSRCKYHLSLKRS
jgi:hypothetical protein